MLSRRHFLRFTGTALAASPWLPQHLASRRAAPFQTVRRNVGVFTERGGTIGWLANSDALVVVDTQYPDSAETCWNGLQERTRRPADLVINTHHHGGHTGGNPFIDIDGGASTQGWIDVLEQVYSDFDDDTRFIFGHGNPEYGITGNRADLLAMRDFLSGLVEYVQDGIDDGQPVETLADRQVLPGFEAHNMDGWPLELSACIQAVHRDLTGAN